MAETNYRMKSRGSAEVPAHLAKYPHEVVVREHKDRTDDIFNWLVTKFGNDFTFDDVDYSRNGEVRIFWFKDPTLAMEFKLSYG